MTSFRTGDWVRVKSSEQIAATLDPQGRLDGLPFMPEMLAHCGQVLRVSQVAHKTCDTVHKTGGRKLESTVHLEDLRCDGAAHGGCEAYCLFFWKTAWLEPASQHAAPIADPDSNRIIARLSVSTVREGKTYYQCQATLLPQFTELLPWWDIRQYFRDVRTGNVALRELLSTGVLQFLRNRMAGPGYNFWRRLHNALQGPLGGEVKVKLEHDTGGAIPVGARTPEASLNLQPGELVEVLPYEEIHATLNREAKNRGMRYDIEMRPYSGNRYRVARRVTRIIHEETGEMLEMKNPSIILEGVYCRSHYSPDRMFCPRRLPSFWREIWLKRVEGIPVRDVTGEPASARIPAAGTRS